MYAYFIGLSIAPIVSTVIELTPMKYRGITIMVFMSIPWVFGEFLAALVGEIVLQGEN